MNINNLLNKAISLAKKSDVHRGKIGAILFTNNGEILTSAHNTTIHGDNTRRTIHAEEFVIKKANKMRIFNRFPKEQINILVTRYRRGDNSIGEAKPCSRCQLLLDKYDIRCYYTTNEGQIKERI